jgi:PilZ domain-containing protein
MKPRQHFDREVRRTRHVSAWINVQGRVHCECKVMDISKNGAKIIAEEMFPDRFQLAFFQGDQNRVCEVVWRRAKVLGVKFIF